MLLERASVIGLEFEWEALGELAAGGRGPGPQLAALVRKELIRPHESIEDTFRFRHLLIRDAAYERIPKELRSELHERFADWLDERGEEFDEIVGYHLEQATGAWRSSGRADGHALARGPPSARRVGAAGLRPWRLGAAANLLERAADLLAAGRPASSEPAAPPGPSPQGDRTAGSGGGDPGRGGRVGRASGDQLVVADATVPLATSAPTGDARPGRGRRRDQRSMATFREVDDEAGIARALTMRGKYVLGGRGGGGPRPS